MALAMGVQNAAAQRLAVPELTTTVLTRTLTGLASEASDPRRTGSKSRTPTARRRCDAAWGDRRRGCSCSSLDRRPLALAAAIVLAVGVAAHVLSRTQAPWLEP